MKQLKFRCLKGLLAVSREDAVVPDDHVALWVDRTVLDELISRRAVESPHPHARGGQMRPSLSELVAALLAASRGGAQ